MGTDTIIFEVKFQASALKIWDAITNPDEMKKWYFEVDDFKPEVGFEFQFEGESENQKYLHNCKILEVIPERKLVHTWKYVGYPGESILTWEIIGRGDRTIVKLYHENIESFGYKNPDFAKEKFIEGWNYILNQSLKEFVEK